MRAIVKVFVVWTLGLTVLFGSAAVSSAAPPTAVVTYCGCTCWYSGAGGKTATKGVTFTSDKSCSVHSGRTCFCDDQTCYLEFNRQAMYKGALDDCKSTPLLKQSDPAAPVRPPGVKPPATQPPAAR